MKTNLKALFSAIALTTAAAVVFATTQPPATPPATPHPEVVEFIIQLSIACQKSTRVALVKDHTFICMSEKQHKYLLDHLDTNA